MRMMERESRMARIRHRLLGCALAAGTVAGVAGGLDLAGHDLIAASAQTTTQYQPWQPSATGSQTLIDELRRMVDQAERDRAASPDFLADLKGLLTRYGAAGGTSAPPATPPAGTRAVFSDDFADGNYTANPAWAVLQGNWQVDAAGLRSDVPAASGAQAGGIAAIALPQRMPNAFAIGFDLQAFAGGQFELRVYQGAAREAGYRLVYRADASPSFAIYRSGSSGIRQLSATTSAQALPSGGKARIGWTRDAAGVMRITLDGRDILTASDSAFRDPWEGVLLVNFGGNFATRSIAAQ
jgi:hypothetical protein